MLTSVIGKMLSSSWARQGEPSKYRRERGDVLLFDTSVLFDQKVLNSMRYGNFRPIPRFGVWIFRQRAHT